MPAVRPIQAIGAPTYDVTGYSEPDAGPARFTVDGSVALEDRLRETCSHVLEGVQCAIPGHSLQAVLLGGGYGRGEGGVLQTSAEDAPYNDLEFYIFIRGNRWMNRKRFGPGLHALAERLSTDAGVEVEFHALSLEHLQASPPSMFYYDLVSGHRWVLGEESLLAGCEKHRRPELIPMAEATRLLMNRCSGVLFAAQKLAHPVFTDDDADFVERNLAKIQLALGDAMLTVVGSYHWSCRERNRRLRSLSTALPFEPLDKIREHHARGVAFKLHPRRASSTERERLLSLHQTLAGLSELVWLWVENQRLNSAFSTPHDYVTSSLNKMPGSNPWQNFLRNLAAFGPASLLGRDRFRHPRERALRMLAQLLWNRPPERTARQDEPALTVTPAEIDGYRRLWSRVQ